LERTKRVHREHLRDLHQWPRQALDCVCEFQVGRFRKQKALGCGKSRCLLCHFDKIFGIQSVKDRIRPRRFLDSLNDYHYSSLSDDELVLIAEETFLELDGREAEEKRSDDQNPINQL
jgi:hypothetical protein